MSCPRIGRRRARIAKISSRGGKFILKYYHRNSKYILHKYSDSSPVTRQVWSVCWPRGRDETRKLGVSMGKGLTYVGTFYLRLQIRFIVAARTVQVQNCILPKKHNGTALYLFSTDTNSMYQQNQLYL